MSAMDTWFPYRRGSAGPELFAFPHAGASTTVFNDLREELGHGGVALSGGLLPGRGRRVRERPYRSTAALVAAFGEVAAHDNWAAFEGEYALLGHCSGALVAYEIAQLLVRAPCPNPRLLVVCSCLPPRLVFDTGMGRLPTRELLAQTADMGGTQQALMDDPDFLTLLERPLRADWELYDGYAHRAQPPLPLPVLAVRGTNDGNVDAPDLRIWQEQTSERLLTAEVDADHWALESAPALAAAVLHGLAVVGAGTAFT